MNVRHKVEQLMRKYQFYMGMINAENSQQVITKLVLIADKISRYTGILKEASATMDRELPE